MVINILDWEEFRISVNRLCRGNEHKDITAEIIQLGATSTVIDSTKFTISMIKHDIDTNTDSFTVKINSGKLKLLFFDYHPKSTFLQFIRAAIEIFPIYLIDFSSQIKNLDSIQENKFLEPIKYANEIIKYYNSDSYYLVYGTGLCFQDCFTPSYYFAITGNIFQPKVPSYEMLENYYKSTTEATKPMGPCDYSEAIKHISNQVRFESAGGNKYFSLLIICSQDASNQESLNNSLNSLVELPISVIFIGIFSEYTNYSNINAVCEEINANSKRKFVNFGSFQAIESLLEGLAHQLLQYATVKGVTVRPIEQSRKLTKSVTMHHKTKNNAPTVKADYYSKFREDTINYLTKNGYNNEDIKRINQFGMPYIINIENISSPLYSMKNRSRTITNKKSKSSQLVCKNCQVIVKKLGILDCGCQIFCEDCSLKLRCPSCKN